jgi:hypothetical protein
MHQSRVIACRNEFLLAGVGDRYTRQYGSTFVEDAIITLYYHSTISAPFALHAKTGLPHELVLQYRLKEGYPSGAVKPSAH